MNREKKQTSLVFWSIVIMIACLAFQNIPQVEATVVWSDDFTDGDIAGWTVLNGTWDASSGYLDASGAQSPQLNTIIHESNVTNGIFSFDIYKTPEVDAIDGYFVLPMGYDLGPMASDLGLVTYYSFGIWIRMSTIVVVRVTNNFVDEIETYTHDEPLDGWYAIKIAFTSNSTLRMWVNGVMEIDTVAISTLTESDYFYVMSPLGGAIDNVVIEEEDVDPTTTEPTTTEPTETTTPTGSEPPPAIPMELLALGIAVPVIIIVVVIVFKKR